MKQTLFKNLPYKILALICAVPLWIILVNISNPMDSVTISGIQVSPDNEAVVKNETMTYDILNGSDKVSVIVTARKKDIKEISAADFKATAVMSRIADTSEKNRKEVPIVVEVVSDKTIIKDNYRLKGNGVMEIRVEDIIERTFPVKVEWTGDLAEDVTIENEITSPANIKIKAKRSELAKISQVKVNLDRSEITAETTKLNGKIKLFDGNGSEIKDTSKLVSVSDEEAEISFVALKSKTIEVRYLDPVGIAATGYRYSQKIAEPKQIKIIGTKAAMADLDYVEIPGENYPVTTLTDNREYQVDISRYLPENVRIAEDSSSIATVTIVVEKLETKYVRLKTNDLILTGESEVYDYIFPNNNIVLQIQGFKEDLDNLKDSDIVLELNVAGCVPSDELYYRQLTIKVSLEYAVQDSITLGFKVKDKTAPSESESESVSPSESETESEPETETEPEPEVTPVPETPSESESESPSESELQTEESSNEESLPEENPAPHIPIEE